MQRTSFDFDVITGPPAKNQEDRRQPSHRKDWNIAASLRTAAATDGHTRINQGQYEMSRTGT